MCGGLASVVAGSSSPRHMRRWGTAGVSDRGILYSARRACLFAKLMVPETERFDDRTEAMARCGGKKNAR